jgi:hypothetical protein
MLIYLILGVTLIYVGVIVCLNLASKMQKILDLGK